jgi:hypothetical protein
MNGVLQAHLSLCLWVSRLEDLKGAKTKEGGRYPQNDRCSLLRRRRMQGDEMLAMRAVIEEG